MKTIFATRQKWTEILDLTGSDWRMSRFSAYIGVLDELVQLSERRKYDPNAYRGFREDLAKQELLFEATSQLLQLQLSSTVWSRLDARVLTKKLKKVLLGTVMPIPDNHALADEPRDTLVELQTAALMANCGFEPQITANAEDLQLHLADHPPVLAECKRPVSEESLSTALTALRGQLWKRAKGKQCLAVIAAERIHGLNGGLSKADGSEAVDADVIRRLEMTGTAVQKICSTPRRGLAAGTVGLATISGAVLITKPTMHLYPFTTMRPFDIGDGKLVPDWFVRQLRQDTGLLRDFAGRPS